MPLFKNYHIVIFKDREGGFKNLRLRGWLGILLFSAVCGLAGVNLFLWGYYNNYSRLEMELEEARQIIQAGDGQLLNLAGKLKALEGDLRRVQQFDTKLKVMANIETAAEGADENSAPAGFMNDPVFLARHRELFIRRAHTLAEDLSSSVQLEEVQQQALVYFLRENRDVLLSTPSIWPVKGFLTSGFGRRSSPFTGLGTMHQGLDISNRPGTPVLAPARGSVTFSGPDGSYGNCVVIDHGNGITTRYAHMQKTSVTVGQYVQRGDVIGALGNTGRSTGPHLHYEVSVGGVPVDPMRYILN